MPRNRTVTKAALVAARQRNPCGVETRTEVHRVASNVAPIELL